MRPEPSAATEKARKRQAGGQVGTIIGDAEDITVAVAGERVEVLEVTKKMKQQMTHEVYGRIVKAQRSAGGMD